MKKSLKIFFLFLTIHTCAHFIYWKNYWKPELFFWDENYHIASAAKYLKGVFFMEPHPPLGKLLLAYSEHLVGVNNGVTFGYEKFDLIPHEFLNSSFSFAGYRFLPALFAVFNVMLFSAIAYLLTQSLFMTFCFASLPLLDTALLVHSRGAMLDSFLIFGHLLCILAFLFLLREEKESQEKRNYKIAFWSFVMSFAFVFAFMTKIFGLALVVLWPLLYFYKKDSRNLFLKIFPLNAIFIIALSTSIWGIHFSLGKKIQPSLQHQGLYWASSQHEKWLLGFEKDSIWHLPQKIHEQLRYMFFYEQNVSAIDWDEKVITGSYALTWPLGARPVPYRWQKRDSLHSYLYMIPNPWAWGAGLVGLIFALALFIRRSKKLLQQSKPFSPELFSMLVLYFTYWIPMIFIQRVLYLYHYLPILFCSWILLICLVKMYDNILLSTQKIRLKYGLIAMLALVFVGFQNYKLFVFYTPSDCKTFNDKHYFPFWGMKFQSCINESKENKILRSANN